ncbi:MAG: hypothetical protein CMJ25_24785 [Phycisphaerae bacterium]|jgi:hypothetical protein|nr:hypothetical protein [Phycisphaerae bacterium]|tara:strand:- start:234 stop:647 length:414 start_codon:yes stop_codon:yes gene_type:complete
MNEIKKGEEMINKLYEILNEYDANKIDNMMNINGIDWISKFDNEMQRHGFSVVKDGKMSVRMTAKETKLFMAVKFMGMQQIKFLLDALQNVLKSYNDEMNIKEKELNTLKKIIDLKVLNQTENGKTELQGISPKTKT